MMDFKADSHELAHMEPDIKGIVDKNRNFGAKDVGWHKPSADIPSPLINTVPNGRLWSMIRRFNEVSESALPFLNGALVLILTQSIGCI